MSEFHLVSAVLIFAASAVPIYLAAKTRKEMRKLMSLLATFALVHAGYHSFAVFGYELLAESILEPASVAVLLAFGAIYAMVARARRRESGV